MCAEMMVDVLHVRIGCFQPGRMELFHQAV